VISIPTSDILLPLEKESYYQLVLIDFDSAVSGQFSAFNL
jgi:hypothetical protein